MKGPTYSISVSRPLGNRASINAVKLSLVLWVQVEVSNRSF